MQTISHWEYTAHGCTRYSPLFSKKLCRISQFLVKVGVCLHAHSCTVSYSSTKSVHFSFVSPKSRDFPSSRSLGCQGNNTRITSHWDTASVWANIFTRKGRFLFARVWGGSQSMGVPPVIIQINRIFHYQPSSELGVPRCLWKPPYGGGFNWTFPMSPFPVDLSINLSCSTGDR